MSRGRFTLSLSLFHLRGKKVPSKFFLIDHLANIAILQYQFPVRVQGETNFGNFTSNRSGIPLQNDDEVPNHLGILCRAAPSRRIIQRRSQHHRRRLYPPIRPNLLSRYGIPPPSILRKTNHRIHTHRHHYTRPRSPRLSDLPRQFPISASRSS